jgi:hypothetical protein
MRQANARQEGFFEEASTKIIERIKDEQFSR